MCERTVDVCIIVTVLVRHIIVHYKCKNNSFLNNFMISHSDYALPSLSFNFNMKFEIYFFKELYINHITSHTYMIVYTCMYTISYKNHKDW